MDKTNIEALLKIAAKELKVKDKKSGNAELEVIREFISRCDIKSSDEHIVSLAIIFDKYKTWAKNSEYRRTPSNQAFSKLFALNFNKVIKHGIVYFEVSPKGFDLSAENQQRIKQKNEKTKTKKKS
jgi:hypothetical protein